MKLSIYADDTCMIIAVEPNQYKENAKTELKNILNWFHSNLLLLNIEKTDYNFFGPFYNKVYEKGEYDLTELHTVAPRLLFDFERDPLLENNYPTPEQINKKGYFTLHDLHEITPLYYLDDSIETDDGVIISPSDVVKYLGLFIDNEVKFKYHINIVISKISRMIGNFWRAECIDIETKKIIYHSLVESYLSYGILIWCSDYAKNLMVDSNYDRIPDALKQLCKTQNKIIRAIFRKPNYNKITKTNTQVTSLYSELGVLKLQERYYYHLGILMHDFFNSKQFPALLKQKFLSFLPNSKISMSTRNEGFNLSYSISHFTYAYKKPSVASAVFWNSLPTKIKLCTSRKTFKKILKQHLISRYVD